MQLGTGRGGGGGLCEVSGREADQHHVPEERSSQLHHSDTLRNSHLAMLVCTYVHSADETGSVTSG